MIEIVPAENDNVAFLAKSQRIVNGAVSELRLREVFLVNIDNWFDHKWLGWWSRKEEELRVPTFTPNRVVSERHFVWQMQTSVWESARLERPLHLRQAGRPWLAQPLSRFSENAAFVWYSGNTAHNTSGSLMFYVSGAGGYSWYASFRGDREWTLNKEFQVTKRELRLFENRGSELASAQV